MSGGACAGLGSMVAAGVHEGQYAFPTRPMTNLRALTWSRDCVLISANLAARTDSFWRLLLHCTYAHLHRVRRTIHGLRLRIRLLGNHGKAMPDVASENGLINTTCTHTGERVATKCISSMLFLASNNILTKSLCLNLLQGLAVRNSVLDLYI